MRRRHLLALPLLAPLARPATQAQAQVAERGLPVVASFSILGDMVAQIGGDRVQLRASPGRTSMRTPSSPAPPTPRRCATPRWWCATGSASTPGWTG